MKDTLAFFGLFLRRGGDARPVYDLLSTNNNLGERSLYLNLGYWERARGYDEACGALADLLAEEAGMGEDDEVLDVGFGFADQDMRWAQARRPKRITGLNITASQVEVARRRVAERGLQGRVELLVGSATAMPFPEARFDKVTALETAFHYDTRERFFQEAFRVLRPGGRLALADIVPYPGARSGLLESVGDWLGRRFWQIPKANMYPMPEYEAKLRAAGFASVRWRSIAGQVYAPFARHASRRLAGPEAKRLHPLIRAFWKASVDAMLKVDLPLDYVLVAADKAG